MHEHVSKELIDNALDHLLRAAEDARTGDERLLKSSLISLGTAVEVLLKARLLSAHWCLIFADVDKASENSLSSGEFSSVDFGTAINRLKNVCAVELSAADRADLEQLRKLRNKTIHFKLQINPAQVKSMLAKGCNFVINFSKKHLRREINLNGLAWTQITQELGEFGSFVEERLREIDDELKAAKCLLSCERCSRKTLCIGDGPPNCLFCGFSVSATELAESLQDDGVAYTCPICGEDACTVLGGEDVPYWQCMACGTRDTEGTYSICGECNQQIIVTGEICDRCLDELRTEEDEEEE